MPVEIRELQIRVNVNQSSSTPIAGSTAAPGNNGNNKEEMVNQCIEEVLDILNSKKER